MDITPDDARISAIITGTGGGTDPFSAAMHATRVPMVVTNPRLPDNPVLFANDAFCRLTGYDRSEIVGRNCRFLQGPESDQATIARIRAAVQAEQGIEVDMRNHRKDGVPFWSRLLMAPVRDADGQLAYFFASQVDVTLEREQLAGLESANAALVAELAGRLREQQDSEARLRFATQAGRMGTWELDLQTGAFTACGIARGNLGAPPDGPLTHAAVRAAIHADDRARVDAAMAHALDGGGDYDAEYRVLRPGSVGWVQMRAQVVRAPGGTPLRMAGISMDVTERRAAEQRLELSEAFLRLATEASGVAPWDYDAAAGTMDWTPAMRQMFGIQGEVAPNLDAFYAVLHPDDRDATLAEFEAALDPARRAPYDVEYRIIGRDDGVMRWLGARGRGVFEGGRCVRAVGMLVDITERRAAEERRAFLAGLLEHLRTLADPRAVMEAAVAALAGHLGAERVGYGEVGENEDTLTVRTCVASGVQPLAGEYRLSDFGRGMAGQFRAGLTATCADLTADPAYDPAAWASIETRAYASVPLVRGGRLCAILFVNRRQAHTWTPGETAAMEDVAARTWDAVERARAEAALRDANEAQLRAVFETSFHLQGLLSPDGTLLDANATSLDAIRARREDVVGRPFWETPWFSATPGAPEMVRASVAAAAGGTDLRRELSLNVLGSVRIYDFSIRPVRGSDGAVVGIVPSALDITERRAAEEALRQSQKMEAVGQLTGGIAHDFNNLLAAITGSLEMVQRRVAAGRTDGLDRFATAAITGAQRAASLTQRLLAFARRQPLDPRRVDTAALLSGMEDMLRRTLGAGIELHMDLGRDVRPTLCDPNQLEAAVLNLAINARDAMPGGGRLTVGTANAQGHPGLPPGGHVMLRVADTGTGMTPDVLARAFDPFFTTKPIGQGTGLGLSMLYGFVKQSDGHVRVTSAPGEGTEFRLYLPCYGGPAPDEAVPAAPAVPAEAGETVLVVEDEATVRMLVAETLRELGYATLEAADGPAGLKALQGGARVDLLVTDVGLPGLNGRQLADAARALRPGLPVLFMTGYAHGAVGGGDALEAGMELIAKPFELDALARKVRAMLEG